MSTTSVLPIGVARETGRVDGTPLVARRMPTISNLQILRFVAAAMVMFGHVEHELRQSVLSRGEPFPSLNPVFWAGGVDVFFVISGFIMYHIGWRKFGSAQESGRFLVKRLIRIVPPYWLFTALLLCVMALRPQYLAHSSTTLWHTVASFLLIPANNPSGWFFPVLINGWTLNYEFLFYVLFAAAMLLPLKQGMMLLVAMLTLLSLGVFAHLPSMPWQFWCNPIVLEFVFGIALAILYERGRRIGPLVAILLALAAVALMLWTQRAGIAGNHYEYRFAWMGIPAALLCAAMVLLPAPAHKGVAYRWLVIAGDASYALYLAHPFSLGAAAILIRSVGISDPWLYILVSLAISIGASIVLHLYLERPFHTWLDQRIFGRKVANVRA